MSARIEYWVAGSIIFGAGTAMAYPTLHAVVGDVAHPSWRGAAVGVYRLWRDIGFALGAVLAGILADLYSIQVAIIVVGVITAARGLAMLCSASGNPGWPARFRLEDPSGSLAVRWLPQPENTSPSVMTDQEAL